MTTNVPNPNVMLGTGSPVGTGVEGGIYIDATNAALGIVKMYRYIGGVWNAVNNILDNCTVGALPAASTALKGARGTVTDSNATLTAAIGATVANASGSANIVPVFCDGTNWKVG